MQLIGQKNNLELIDKWQTLPNFIIIQGPPHTGKTYLTTYLCKKYSLYYSEMNNSVKNIRSLIEVMKKDSNMLYHFKDFDSASIQAKNALLKVTEEPVPGNYIVITGGPQIKTLESRARRIIMEPYTFEELYDMLQTSFVLPDDMKDLYKLEDGTIDLPRFYNELYMIGINTPAKIQYYMNYDKVPQLAMYASDVFSKITYLSSNTYIPMISKFEDRYIKEKGSNKPTVDACMLFLDMLICLTENAVIYKQKYSYNQILTQLLNAKYALQKDDTLKRKMLLYKTFYNISNLQGGNI